MSSWINSFREKRQKIEWFPILVVRFSLGLFFILSGFFKLFDGEHHYALLKTLENASLPRAEFFSFLFPLLECTGGVCILIGYWTSLASLALLFLNILALMTGRGSDATQYRGIMAIENLLYLPEFLYALLFLWLIFSGPGKISLDSHRAKKSGSAF